MVRRLSVLAFTMSLLAACSSPADPLGVASVDPQDGATNVPTAQAVTVLFDGPVDGSTLLDGGFVLLDGDTQVEADVEADGPTAVLTPRADLAEDTEYTVVLSDSVASAFGGRLAGGHDTTFTTVASASAGSGDPDAAGDRTGDGDGTGTGDGDGTGTGDGDGTGTGDGDGTGTGDGDGTGTGDGDSTGTGDGDSTGTGDGDGTGTGDGDGTGTGDGDGTGTGDGTGSDGGDGGDGSGAVDGEDDPHGGNDESTPLVGRPVLTDGRTLVMVFENEMDPATLKPQAFKIEGGIFGEIKHSFDSETGHHTVTLELEEELPEGQHTVILTTHLADVDGDKYEQDVRWPIEVEASDL